MHGEGLRPPGQSMLGLQIELGLLLERIFVETSPVAGFESGSVRFWLEAWLARSMAR